MGVKISELPVTSSVAANDKMVVNHENVTNQITVEDLIRHTSYFTAGSVRMRER